MSMVELGRAMPEAVPWARLVCTGLLLTLGMVVPGSRVPGQTPDLATVRGQVIDQSGAAVPDTGIAVTKARFRF